MTFSIPKGWGSRKYKINLEEILEDVYPTKSGTGQPATYFGREIRDVG